MALNGEMAEAPYSTSAVSTSSSGTFTAETIVDTITASLIVGRVYEIRYYGNFSSSVANDTAGVGMRQDDVSGTQMDSTDLYLPVGTSRTFKAVLCARYTAAATGSKTFVATGSRRTGTGNITRYASTAAPAQLFVADVF